MKLENGQVIQISPSSVTFENYKQSTKRVQLDQVAIEVTRVCNVGKYTIDGKPCAHCLRGCPEKAKIKKEYIDLFFENVECINNLVITGGEPTLAVDMIEYILEVCMRNGIEVYTVWATTNGVIKSRKFLDVMTRFIEYSKEFDGEMSGVSLSTDQFHGYLPEENYWFYRSYEYYDDCKDRGKLESTLPEGLAAWNGLETNRYTRVLDDDTLTGYMDGSHVAIEEGMVYLNALGDIVLNCDYSYDTQRERAVTDVKTSDFWAHLMMFHSDLEFEDIDLDYCAEEVPNCG